MIWWVVNLAKYGQPASYHTYSAKAWGVSLFVATIALFGFGYGGFTLNLAIAVGIIHTVEEIAMMLILPKWTHDVLSIVHALSTAPILLKRKRAIAYYQAALQVYTREAFPQDWAMSQNNLGIAYRERIRGDRAENLERAIACYQAALQVRTREVLPQQWAATQNNLGTAYGNRLLGDRAGNLERAIACYQNALQVYTHEAFPERWAGTQNNLGNAYRELAQLAEAITCYRNALKIFTPTAFPIDCLRTGRNLGNTAFTAKVWDTAIEGFAIAIEAVEQSHSWATSELRRQEILEEANDIYQKIVEACVAHGQMDKAIEYVERSKARNLIDLIATRNLYPKGDIPTEVLKEFKHLQREIETEYRKIDITETNHFNEGNINSLANTRSDRTHLNQLRQKLNDLIVREIQPIDPTFCLTYRVEPISFKQIQSLLPETTLAFLSGTSLTTTSLLSSSPVKPYISYFRNLPLKIEKP